MLSVYLAESLRSLLGRRDRGHRYILREFVVFREKIRAMINIRKKEPGFNLNKTDIYVRPMWNPGTLKELNIDSDMYSIGTYFRLFHN